MNYITRNLEQIVMQATAEYSVVLVTGPGQAGKTTMLQKLMEISPPACVTLDDLNKRNPTVSDPEWYVI